MLKRSRNNKQSNKGVLVKLAKKKQDLRVDLPTVGFNTLVQCKAVGIKGIVLKAKQHIFFGKKQMHQFC